MLETSLHLYQPAHYTRSQNDLFSAYSKVIGEGDRADVKVNLKVGDFVSHGQHVMRGCSNLWQDGKGTLRDRKEIVWGSLIL